MERRRRAWAVVGCLLVVAAGVWAQAPPPSADVAAQTRRVRARIDALQREAERLAANERTVLSELRQREITRDLRVVAYTQASQDLARVTARVEAISARLASHNTAVATQRPDLSRRVVDLYKLGRGGYLRMLLTVDDLQALGRAYRFVSALQSFARRRAAAHAESVRGLERSRGELLVQQAALARSQAEVARARDAAIAATTRLTELIDTIDAQRDMNARFLAELQDAHQRLQTAIAHVATGATHDAAMATLPIRPFKGDLAWPLDGRVLTPFGRSRQARFHTAITSNGVVLAAQPQAPVRAIHEGVVAFAEAFPGFGNLVIIDHGQAAFTMYGHLATMAVTVGSQVTRGMTIGDAGVLIDGTPALYFELRIDGKPVDPLQWLRTQ